MVVDYILRVSCFEPRFVENAVFFGGVAAPILRRTMHSAGAALGFLLTRISLKLSVSPPVLFATRKVRVCLL